MKMKLTWDEIRLRHIADLESRLAKQAEIISVMREALEAYSNINHWDGCEFALMDKGDVCGYLKDGAPNGQRAREALAKAEEMLK